MKNTLGQYIAQLREEKGWSQRELARRVNVDPRTIQKIENGETQSPGFQLVLDLSRALNTKIERLALSIEGKDPDTISISDSELQEIAVRAAMEALRLKREGKG